MQVALFEIGPGDTATLEALNRLFPAACRPAPASRILMTGDCCKYSVTSGPWLQADSGQGTLVLRNLQPGTSYRVRVATRFANGVVSKYSSPATFTTLR